MLSQDLKMHRVAAKYVPCVLTHDQKQTRLNVCRELKEQLENDPDLSSKIITDVYKRQPL